MARRSRRWGNALGGYKTQSRKKNGQFGTGGVSFKKKAKPQIKAKKASSTPRKKMSKKKKAAIAAGVVVAAGAAWYGVETLSINREFKRSGGAHSVTTLPGGLSVTTTRTLKRGHVGVDGASVSAMADATTLRGVATAGAGIWRPSLRPQIHSTSYIHDGDQLMGYYNDVTKGRRLYGESVYLRPSVRGNRRVVSALSNSVKDRQSDMVASGRKIVISKYRSEDSERIVRNQARKLGKNNVKVQKRYNPSSGYARDITESMDAYFFNSVTREFRNTRNSRGRRVGVVI